MAQTVVPSGTLVIRFRDADRVLELSVRDLVERAARGGDLMPPVVQTLASRAAAGRRAHQEWQGSRAEEDAGFMAEKRLEVQLEISGWTCVIQGRVDGLTEVAGRLVVEELKSSTLPDERLQQTQPRDFPSWTNQLRIYLWMLHLEGHEQPIGQLVLVSLVDGSQHVRGVPPTLADTEREVRARLEELIRRRERRLAWMSARRVRSVPDPFENWRTGQREIVEAVQWGVEHGRQVLVEAPTGMGKTAAVLTGVLRTAMAHGKTVFWATQRTTQQTVVADAIARMRSQGLSVRAVTLSAKEKVCLNEVVACRAETCQYAAGYYDKLAEAGQPDALADDEVHADRAALQALGRTLTCCPFELALDLSDQVDLVVGDVNYALDPTVALKRHFSESPDDWIVVVDEVHQMVERARGWWSPAIECAVAWRAADLLRSEGEWAEPFVVLAQQIGLGIEHLAQQAEASGEGDEVQIERPDGVFADAATRIDQLALDYAMRRLDHPLPDHVAEDPYLVMCRAVLHFRSALREAGDETVALVRVVPGGERLSLLCLDPSPHVGPRIAALGGFVGCSATLRPPEFHRDLLGLDAERLDVVSVPSPFPPENRTIHVAPRISTLYRDRAAHAPRTAELVAQLVTQIGGNVAVYFPSFAMLNDIAERWDLDGHQVLRQRSGMDDAEREAWLTLLGDTEGPVVLAAVLGGVFAEGIDLPPGALSGVIVVGPGLPPVGLERDLLRRYYEDRYGRGHAYASLIPGVTRVVQAAGRLIRRPEDTGTIVLVGRRFRWRDVRALLPSDWDPTPLPQAEV